MTSVAYRMLYLMPALNFFLLPALELYVNQDALEVSEICLHPYVRLPDGTSLTQTFRAREQLAAVRLYVELHRGEEPGQDQDPVQLLSGFPRRAFSEADMERPLQELGLVPSAVLIVAKKCPS
ncbi:UBX domain-containing protein 1 [Cricetulus griseus]|uniref:UBX domain-containing protein 1 n=1 Tax=Cricetulus griseus TaxID=10029 RepID=G3IPH9_CRIGR|nr:UBX domain-containing protein 1 [Cricetulus griseus]